MNKGFGYAENKMMPISKTNLISKSRVESGSLTSKPYNAVEINLYFRNVRRGT